MTERVLRILAGIGYVAEHDTRVYTPTIMTRQMTDRLSIAVLKFMYIFSPLISLLNPDQTNSQPASTSACPH